MLPILLPAKKCWKFAWTQYTISKISDFLTFSLMYLNQILPLHLTRKKVAFLCQWIPHFFWSLIQKLLKGARYISIFSFSSSQCQISDDSFKKVYLFSLKSLLNQTFVFIYFHDCHVLKIFFIPLNERLFSFETRSKKWYDLRMSILKPQNDDMIVIRRWLIKILLLNRNQDILSNLWNVLKLVRNCFIVFKTYILCVRV